MKKNKFIVGLSLIFGSVLLILTMVLHPSGGTIEHIINTKSLVMISHSLAISSLPIICFGSLGLSTHLSTSSKLSYLGFISICFGLVAAMIAGTINGITLPMFLEKNYSSIEAETQLIRIICSYGNFINKPMVSIMMATFSFSIFIWSVIILQTRKLSIIVGYWGLMLTIFVVIMNLSSYNFLDLNGFSAYIFGNSSWIIAAGINISKS